MSKRLFAIVALAAGSVALSGCVVAPVRPAYGYGYGYGPYYRAAPPPAVVVVPRPVYSYGPYPRRW
jgi:hypothetical protein